MIQQPAVYAVDDDPAVLDSLRAILVSSGFHVSAFHSARSFLENAKLDGVGCLVTDLNMPEITGIDLQKQLVTAESTLAIVFVTGYANVPSTVQIMESGAVTLLEKPYAPTRLIQAVQTGIGKSVQLHAAREAELRFKKLVATLSDEEIQVMDCASAGMPNKAIGRKLFISSRTVDRRRQSAMRKLQINSVSEYAVIRSLNPPR